MLHREGCNDAVSTLRSCTNAISAPRRLVGRLGRETLPGVSDLVERAEKWAEKYLSDALPRRWRHVQAVASKATRLAATRPPADGEALISAAWLHDVGYAPELVDTELHALDGARHLRAAGFPDRVAALVAHHSCAIFEAAERGLSTTLAAEFPHEQSPVSDALWYADMTTGPDGQSLPVEERLAEICERYGPEHLVTRFWSQAEPTNRGSQRPTAAP